MPDAASIYALADSIDVFDDAEKSEALRTLQDHLIELRMRPPDPAVGRVKGATQPQLDLWDAFFRHEHMIFACPGSNQCVGPDTLIDSPDGSKKISEIKGKHRVFAYGRDGDMIVEANEPFIKGTEFAYRVHLSNGESFVCTGEHRMRHICGRYYHACHLFNGDLTITNPFLCGPSESSVLIQKVEYAGQTDIYDFEVPTHHNYRAHGIYHHNSGKTEGVGVCFCKHIRDTARDGDVYWVLAQSYNTLKDVPLKTIYQLLPAEMFPRGSEYDPTIREIPTMKLRLPDGRGHCEIWWRSEDQGIMKLESARLNGIWWTECESQPIFDALLPRLVARNGWMLMDYVPFYGWHRTILREKANMPGSPIFLRKFTIYENRHNLEPGTIEKMKASMSAQAWEVRGLGKEAAAQGAVYQNFNPDDFEQGGHMVDPFPVPDYWPLFLAGDWGFNAPHAFGLFTLSPNDTHYLVAEDYRAQMSVPQTVEALWEMVNAIRPMRLYEGCRTPGEMFEQMKAIDYRRRKREMDEDFFEREEELFDNEVREHVTEEFSRVIPAGCVVDTQIFQRHGSSHGNLANEFRLAGLPVRPCNKGRRGKSGFDLPGIETVRRLFDMRKLLFFKTCPMTRRDHVAWMYKEGKDHTVLPSDRYSEENSHGCDMTRYFLLSAPQFATADELSV